MPWPERLEPPERPEPPERLEPPEPGRRVGQRLQIILTVRCLKSDRLMLFSHDLGTRQDFKRAKNNTVVTGNKLPDHPGLSDLPHNISQTVCLILSCWLFASSASDFLVSCRSSLCLALVSLFVLLLRACTCIHITRRPF